MPDIYKIYTIPNCEKCKDAKEIMQSKGMVYNEVNLAMPDGKKEFGKIYFSIESKIKRDEHKMSILPILLKFRDEVAADKLEEIVQGEDIKPYLLGESNSINDTIACPAKCSY